MAEATQMPSGGKSRTFGTSRTGHFNLGNSYRYPLNMMLGALQILSGLYGGETNRLLLPQIEPQFIGRPVRRLVIIPMRCHIPTGHMEENKRRVQASSNGQFTAY
jgi:hypothetical protein